jgi:molybdate transport system permease protein
MIWSSLKLSLLVVSLATLIISIVGTALAFLFAKRNFRGKDLLDAVFTLPMVLPPTVTGYYLIVLLGRRGLLGGFHLDRGCNSLDSGSTSVDDQISPRRDRER